MNRFSNIVNNTKKKNTITLASILTILLIIALLIIICVPNINFATNKNIVENNVMEIETVLKENNSTDVTNTFFVNTVNTEVSEEKNNIINEVNSEEDDPKLITTTKYLDTDINISNPLKDTYTVTSRFGKRGTAPMHTGIDLNATTGTNIYASTSGEIVFSGWKGSYGYMVIVQYSESLSTYYTQCSEILVNTGDIVKEGDLIAKVGSTGNSTGPHLHYEIRIDKVAVNPEIYINF